ncbi:MAG: ATP-binding protein [Actinomycetales bacterium]
MVTLAVTGCVILAVALTLASVAAAFESSQRAALDTRLRAQVDSVVGRDTLTGSDGVGSNEAPSSQSTAPVDEPTTATGNLDGELPTAGGPLRLPAPGQGTVAQDLPFSLVVGDGDPIEDPLPASVGAVAAGTTPEVFFDVSLGGARYRMLAEHVRGVGAVVVGVDLTPLDTALDRLRTMSLIIGAAGTVLALLLALAVSRVVLAPVARLTREIEAAGSDPLHASITVDRHDELGRVGHSVNGLLRSLAESATARQRLIDDASHELRSPLASLRMNLDVLSAHPDMSDQDRVDLLSDVRCQTGELTALVDDLVVLARGEPPAGLVQTVDLAEVVESALRRATPRARVRGVQLIPALDSCLVAGVRTDLERMVTNLLDNAIKWSPPRGRVEVSLSPQGELRVRDEGPGIAPSDRDHLFERFYRAPAARGMPGSGLGLAIVAKVVHDHGGQVRVADDDDPGTQVVVRLPALATVSEEASGLSRG